MSSIGSTTCFEEPWWAALVPDFTGKKRYSIPAACTQISKAQPKSSNKFKLVSPKDANLRALSAFAKKNKIRSSISQAMVWIYKDKSTLEEINKVVQPGLTESNYLDAAYYVGDMGCADFSAEHKRCLAPRLLMASTADKKATMWLGSQLESTDSKALVAYLKANSQELTKMLSDDEFGIRMMHVVTLSHSLLACSTTEVRTAALGFLQKGIAESKRADFIKKGGLEPIRGAALCADEAEALAAIDCLVVFNSPEAQRTLQSASMWGVSDAVKQKATVAITSTQRLN